MYYDRDGEPIDQHQWLTLFGDPAYKHLARTRVVAGQRAWIVSTVWLGLDHGVGIDGRQIFETMVFVDDPGDDPADCDEFMYRYATEAQARQGHWNVVGLVEAGRDAAITDEDPAEGRT